MRGRTLARVSGRWWPLGGLAAGTRSLLCLSSVSAANNDDARVRGTSHEGGVACLRAGQGARANFWEGIEKEGSGD